MNRKLFFAFLGAFLAMTAAQAQESVAKVSALASGKLLLNGQAANLATIEVEFKKLKNNNGGVWYYRENPQAEPPPQAMAVIELVVKHKLPVSMSSKPDFSDYIDEHGNSKPRKPEQARGVGLATSALRAVFARRSRATLAVTI